MKKSFLIITWSILMLPELSAQSKLGVEHYQYWNQPDGGAVVPMLHFNTRNNWYGELRYNYEEERTFSVFAGRSFPGGKAVTYLVSPLVGFSTGVFTGVSLAVNTEIEWKNFYLSSQTQYSMATQQNTGNFFFSWSELGYIINDLFFTGIAAQYTLDPASNEIHPGFLAGVSFKNISFPLYVFNPFRTGQYFILGVSFEYNFKKKKSDKGSKGLYLDDYK